MRALFGAVGAGELQAGGATSHQTSSCPATTYDLATPIGEPNWRSDEQGRTFHIPETTP